MSLESVRAFFAEKAPDIAVIESDMSSATVVLAAQAYGVEPARIAKTLSLRVGDRVVLIVASGTARMDNKKVKARFGGKPKMLDAAEVADITGHEVGGVCPFGLKTPLPVYCDVSLQAFDEVVPAAGSTHSAVRIAPARMAELTAAEWVDVCGEAGGEPVDHPAVIARSLATKQAGVIEGLATGTVCLRPSFEDDAAQARIRECVLGMTAAANTPLTFFSRPVTNR